MVFDRIRQLLRPLFGASHQDTVAKLLTYLLYASIAANSIYIVFRLFVGGSLLDATSLVVIVMSFLYSAILFVLRKGYVEQAAVILILSAWMGITYKAWIANGIHDTAMIAYVLIIILSALITSWRVAVVISGMSVFAVWTLALSEHWGLRVDTVATPISAAFELTISLVLTVILIVLLVDALKRSVTALRDGEEMFRNIFQATPVAVAITSLHEGRLLEANDTYWRMTGLDPTNSIGRTAVELHLYKDETERRSFLARLLTYGSLRDLDNVFIDAEGVRHETNSFYELIELGDQPTILTMHYDVTQQRKAEEALRKSDERFRKVFHVSPVAIVVTTLDEGRIIDGNNAYWNLAGHDPRTSVGRTTFELRRDLTPEQRERFVQELLEKKSIQDPFYDFVTEQGEHLNTAAFYELIEVDGKAAILSMFYDTTEEDRARNALRHSEARLRAMLEAVPDAVFEMKRDGEIVHFSPSANNELNFHSENMVGQNIARVLPAIGNQIHFAVERALESGQVHAFEFHLGISGENKTFEARISPVGPDLVLIIVRDISLSKWSQSERENLIGELEQKNAELERFTYTVSHDLKSPLITIRGFLGYVREDAEAGNVARLERDMQRIQGATEKMQRLLADLLELSRVGRLKNAPVNIPANALIAEVVELLHGRLNENHVTVHMAEELPAIYGDRQRIFEVFQNLIDNAAKFMGDQPQPRIEIGVRGELLGKPVFFVHDNGVGIQPQFKDKIFGLFEKLNSQSDGTGIGLALVKRIVEFHSGRIWVESEPGRGATFFFTLPTAPTDQTDLSQSAD